MTEKILGMTKEDFLREIRKVQMDATETEIEANNLWLETADEICYGEDFYKLWAEIQINQLRRHLDRATRVMSLIQDESVKADAQAMRSEHNLDEISKKKNW